MSAFSGPEIVNSGLVFDVDFNNAKSISGTTLTDISGTNIPVTLTNAAGATLSIQNGYALFNPSDESNTAVTYYTISNTYFNDIKNEMTLECACFVTTQATGGSRIVSTRTSETSSPLGFGLSFSGITVEVNTSSGWKTGNYSGSEFGNGKWIFVTQTTSVTSDDMKTFTNGNYKGSVSLAATLPNGGNGLLIGRGFYGGIRNCGGGVSFVRVYNRALSNSEIRQNFNALRGRFGV